MTYRELGGHFITMDPTRESYPSDVSDDKVEYLLPYLTLMRDDGRPHGAVDELYVTAA